MNSSGITISLTGKKNGPFKIFRHRHERLAEVRNGKTGTVVRDVIDYDVEFGLLGEFMQKFFIRNLLPRTFAYRQKALEQFVRIIMVRGTGQAPSLTWSAIASLLARFHHHRRTIRENFRDSLHHFGRIVTSADHGVSAQFRRMLQHQVESFSSGFLAQVGQ